MFLIFKHATLYCSAIIAVHVFSGSIKSTGNIFIDLILCVTCGAAFALVVSPISWLILRVRGKDPATYLSGNR